MNAENTGLPPANQTGRPLAGRVLAQRYRLDHQIASGGMAEVWEAHDLVLGRDVAVKILHPQFANDVVVRQRFHIEAIAAARLVDPSIVAIYDTVDLDGCDAIVMELVRGRTLRDFLDERGALEPVEVIHIGAEVAGALAVAHRAGVIHRDIKPANILLSDDGRVLVTDFGIAKVLDEPDLTRTAQVLGTVKYLAPEQVEGGPVDGRTDLYALGAVLYESVCGDAPFRAETPAALALARMHRDPTRPSLVVQEIPLDLESTVMRAMSRAPGDRFASANDMRAALRSTRLHVLADPETIPQPTKPPSQPLPLKRGRSGIFITFIVLAVLLLIALLVANTDAARTLLSNEPATTTTTMPRQLAISTAHSFDPADRTGFENEASAMNAVDADSLTAWSTDTYSTRSFGNLKNGVGLVIDLTVEGPIGAVAIDSPSRGWVVEAYVATGAPTTLLGWGPVRASAIDIAGPIRLSLGDVPGNAVLLWITQLDATAPWQVIITDVIVTS
ncbi:MAG: protein kinase [Acidimicrobiales bacterium]